MSLFPFARELVRRRELAFFALGMLADAWFRLCALSLLSAA
jgi:hypothetical protein